MTTYAASGNQYHNLVGGGYTNKLLLQPFTVVQCRLATTWPTSKRSSPKQ